MPKKEQTLIPVGPQFHTFLAVTAALITAVPYGNKKRRRLENLPYSVGAEAPIARRPLTGKLKVERL
jgi:hypothetical protein